MGKVFRRCDVRCLRGRAPCRLCPLPPESRWRDTIRVMQDIVGKPWSVSFAVETIEGEEYVCLRLHEVGPSVKADEQKERGEA